MTAVLLVAAVVGVLAGEVWFRLRRANLMTSAVLAGQRQAELAHGWPAEKPICVRRRRWSSLNRQPLPEPRAPRVLDDMPHH